MHPTSIWNWVDWLLVGIMVVSVVFAIRKGFVRELISLAAVIMGIILAALWYPRAATWYEDLTKSHDVALAAGFLTVFGLALVGGAIISLSARYLIQKAGVEWFDRLLGGLFGLLRGLVVDSILLMVLMAFAVKPQAVRDSQLAPYVSTGARALVYLMPRPIRENFDIEFQKFRKALIQEAAGNPGQ
jgi:membrane protein required for colicin V production